jgi:membrane protease YdiL (CAAX protease family)
MARARRRRAIALGILRSLLAIPWLAVWIIPWAISFTLSPEKALAVVVIAIALFVYWHVVRRHGRYRERAARLRLRSPRPYLSWLVVATVSKLLLMIVTLAIHQQFVVWDLLPPLPAPSEYPTAMFVRHPAGSMAVLLIVAVLVPLSEEFAFRGWMQYELERVVSARVAILLTALVFCALHGFAIAIHHIPYAIFVGWLVWRTGSLWTAILIHVGNNIVAGTAIILSRGWPEFMPWSPEWFHAVAGGVVGVTGLFLAARQIDRIAEAHRPSSHAQLWPPRVRSTPLLST